MDATKIRNITKQAALSIAVCAALGSSYTAAQVRMGPQLQACCAHLSYEEAEQHAYMTGISAMEYGNPYVFLNDIRYLWTQDASYEKRADINTFYHYRDLTTAEDKIGGSPNNDTIYSMSWLDVSEEPMVISHGKIPEGRYFSFEIANMTSDNIDYVGSRATGSKAGHFAIVGPDWEGKLPGGVKRIESDTNSILIVGRTGVNGPTDLEAAHALQDSYRLAPLSQWDRHGNNVIVIEPTPAIPPSTPGDSTSYWQTMAAVMTENPPPARHEWLLNEYRHLHIGPDLDVTDAAPAIQEGLARAFADYTKHANDVTGGGNQGVVVNNWSYFPSVYGRAGVDNYFRLRTTAQNIGGIIANDPEESVYMPATVDVDGNALDGDLAYELTFAGDNLPPVVASTGFWSITMYAFDFNLVPNELGRYSIGDRTDGITFNQDGGLTIYLQSDDPGGDKTSNWLPSPAGDNFYLIIRLYVPEEPVLEQVWVPGSIVQVD